MKCQPHQDSTPRPEKHLECATMIIQSGNVKELLETLLKPVSLDYISFKSNALQSSALLAKSNGSVLSFSNSGPTDEIHVVNNLKMMSLLIRDKWSEDETDKQEQLNTPNGSAHPASSNTNDNCYKYDLSSKTGETLTTNIYTYEIEDLHACVCQIPQSDLLLLFIADNSFPYGLLALKMQKALEAFSDLYGYKLG